MLTYARFILIIYVSMENDKNLNMLANMVCTKYNKNVYSL